MGKEPPERGFVPTRQALSAKALHRHRIGRLLTSSEVMSKRMPYAVVILRLRKSQSVAE